LIIVGKNPVFESINAGKCQKIFIRKGTKFNFKSFLNVPYDIIEPILFDKKFGRKVQGIAAEIDFQYEDFEENIQDMIQNKSVVLLDRIVDPQNMGAIVRAAHCFGIKHIIVAKDNQSKVTPAVFKASAGSLFYTKVIEVVNISRTLDNMKKNGFYVYAADVKTEIFLEDLHINRPFVIIIGSEGKGIRPNVLKRADYIFKIPMKGKIDSLNASQSAAIIFHKFSS
jgi:23S rRNA (guanosine2251-2'-O)-methyltransferase